MEHEKVVGGAGAWVIKQGKFYDPARKQYILKCHICKKAFYCSRIDGETCGDTCRQRKKRKNNASGIGTAY